MRDSPTAPPTTYYSSEMNLQHSDPSPSYHSRRLFIGDIPKSLTLDEVKNTMKKLFPEASKIEAYPDIAFGNQNRGFAFVECETQEDAAACRERVKQNPPQVRGRNISCDWAQLENTVSDEVMKQVKILFIRNVHPSVTEERLINFFGGKDAGVEKVKIQRMHAFVHFHTRRQAALKKEETNGSALAGLNLEVVWSKPRPRAHPYGNVLGSTSPTTPSALMTIPPLFQLEHMPVRLPDVITPSVASAEAFIARPTLLYAFQALCSHCSKSFISLPVFTNEIYYSHSPLGIISLFRTVATFSTGIRIEGDFSTDALQSQETAINRCLQLLFPSLQAVAKA